MHPCDQYREQLLESLYALLEPSEDEALRAHLAACPVCQACLVEAQKQLILLGRAALMCPPAEPFAPPLEVAAEETSEISRTSEVVPTSTPATLPMSPVRRRSWRRWSAVAAAAAVLVAVVGGAWWYHGQREQYRGQIATGTRQAEAAEVQVVAVRTDYAKKQKEMARQIAEEFTQVSVVGPAVYQADAPVSYHVTTRDSQGRPRPAEVVLDWEGAEKRELRLKSAGDVLAQLPDGLAGRDDAAKLKIEVRAGGKTVTLEEQVKVMAPSCVTHLALNKSAYRVGEVLFFRTLTLERFSLKPPAEKIALRYTLLDVQGQAKLQRHGYISTNGVGGGEFALTDKLPDGDYTLEVAQLDGQRMQPVRRRLEIRRSAEPDVQFTKQTFRPGEGGGVTAVLPGQPNQPLVSSLHVDGKPVPAPGLPPGAYAGMNLQTDRHGRFTAPFVVPPHVEKEAALVITQKQKDAGKDVARELKKIPIPVIPSRLEVDFYPEGGELIEGVPTRVYYRVRTPQGEPAAPEGYVNLMASKDLAEGENKKKLWRPLLDSRNEAAGMFGFMPDASEEYVLRVTGWPSSDPLKGLIKKQGVALSVPVPVGRSDQPLDVELRNVGPAKQLLVMANCRGRVVDQRFVDLPASNEKGPGQAEVRLTSPAAVGGLIRVTVYEPNQSDLIPLAERLVYRAPAQQLILSATANANIHRPGERATLNIEARDESGTPVPANLLGLIVARRAAPQHQPGLPAFFRLLAETGDDLDNADLIVSRPPSLAVAFDLFGSAGAFTRALETACDIQASHSLDLYLGTHGWRRFVPREQGPPALVKGADDKTGGGMGEAKKSEAKAAAKASADAPVLFHRESRQDQKLALQRALDAVREPAEQQLQRLAAEIEQNRRGATLASLALADFEDRVQRTLRLGLGLLVVALLAVGCLALAVGLVRLSWKQASPRPALAFALIAIFAGLVLYGGVGRQLEPNDQGAARKALDRLNRHEPAPGLPDSQLAAIVRPMGQDNLFFPPTVTKNREPAQPLALSARPNADQAVAMDSATPSRGAESLREDELELSDRLRDLFSEAQTAQLMDRKSAQAKGGKESAAVRLQEATTFARARSFAHNGNYRKGDAQDTVLWAPNLMLPETGASVSFGLSGAPAAYQILLYASSPSGRLGFYRGTLEAR